MTLAFDRRALEALPLRLLVIAVVAGLSIIPASDALDSLKNRSFLQRCEMQLELTIRTSQMMSLEGYGAVRTVKLDFRSDGSLRMDSLTIGGAWGQPGMSSVIMELSSGNRLIRTSLEPVIWMASADGGELCVGSDMFALRLTVASSEAIPLILCEVLPWIS